MKMKKTNIFGTGGERVNPYIPNHDYSRFKFVLFIHQILNIGNDMSKEFKHQDLQMSQINKICVIFNHLKLWVVVATHNLKWVTI